MSTTPTFRKQASIWSLSDGCFVVPQYDDSNADLIAPLVAQARTMLGTSTELQITDAEKYIVSQAAGTTTTTTCPTGLVASDPNDPVQMKCQTQPPGNDPMPRRMTVVYQPEASPLVALTGSLDDLFAAADDGTCFWVLTATGGARYTVRFPPAGA